MLQLNLFLFELGGEVLSRSTSAHPGVVSPWMHPKNRHKSYDGEFPALTWVGHGCSDLTLSVREFLDDISTWIGGLSEVGDPPKWAGIIQSSESLNRTGNGGRKNFPPFSCLTAELEHLMFSCPWSGISVLGLLDFQTFRLRLNYATSFPGS